MKMSSPGLSSQPASSEPSMTVSAPATIALAMSPEYCMPPSPMTGTPAGRQARAASMIAVTWGTPTPATTRVVQIEPGPTPTFTASAPASTMRLGADAGGHVAADDVHLGHVGLEPGHHLQHVAAVPVGRVDHERVDARPRPGPGPACTTPRPRRPPPATRSRPAGSLVACGYCTLLAKSLTVISPASRPDPSTIGSFSTLCWRSRPSAVLGGHPDRRGDQRHPASSRRAPARTCR